MYARFLSTDLQPSRREKVSGFLSATLVVLGLLTMFMLVTWLTQQRKYASVVSRLDLHPSPKNEEEGSGSSGKAQVFQLLDDVGSDNLPWVMEQKTVDLQLVSNLATTELAALEQSGGPKGIGLGDKEGDHRKKGKDKGDGDVVPNWQRWQIRYAAADVREYAAILDAFGVELGVLGAADRTIDYARGLSQSKPSVRSGKQVDERRLHFTFASGDLREADRTLAEKAGLTVDGRVISQFFPEAVKAQLELLEREAIGTRPLSTVRRTQFAIRQGSQGLEFFVLRIEPSRGPTGLAPL